MKLDEGWGAGPLEGRAVALAVVAAAAAVMDDFDAPASGEPCCRRTKLNLRLPLDIWKAWSSSDNSDLCRAQHPTTTSVSGVLKRHRRR